MNNYSFGFGVSVNVWDDEHGRQAEIINAEVEDGI